MFFEWDNMFYQRCGERNRSSSPQQTWEISYKFMTAQKTLSGIMRRGRSLGTSKLPHPACRLIRLWTHQKFKAFLVVAYFFCLFTRKILWNVDFISQLFFWLCARVSLIRLLHMRFKTFFLFMNNNANDVYSDNAKKTFARWNQQFFIVCQPRYCESRDRSCLTFTASIIIRRLLQIELI